MKLLDKITTLQEIFEKVEKEVDDEYSIEGQLFLSQNGKIVHKFIFD